MAAAGGMTLVEPLPLKRLLDDSLELKKERSTVGELISLNARGSIAEAGRRRLSSESDLTDRRARLRRMSSLNSIDKLDSSRRRASLVQRQSSVRSSGYESEREDEVFQDEKERMKSRTMKRRDSMMQILRNDMDSIPCLTALRKHSIRKKTTSDSDADLTTSDDETDRDTSRDQRRFKFRRRSRSEAAQRRQSRLSGSSVSSGGGGSSILTDAELKKLKLIAALNRMGSQTVRTRTESMLSESEVSILEESRIKKKRGSIATRVLLAAERRQMRNRRAPKTLLGGGQEVPTPRSEVVKLEPLVLNDDQKKVSMNVIEKLKNPEKIKLPSIPGSTPRANVEERAVETLNTFRRRLRRKKTKPIQIFRKQARFLVLLLRAWRIHSNAINDLLVTNNESLDMITRSSNMELMFDVTEYKAVKEAKVSQEARRILRKKPHLRTEDDQHYIQIALRNYKSIAEYPVKMQKMIAQRSWVESYDQKRVIVREGHVPMCFYFILSGSAVVSAMDGETTKTVMFLNRGDSFGDIAILNQTRRETTDFTDIFMSGGIRDPEDPFLKSISFLDGWPLIKLIENPKKCIFSYFKRGTVLVNDNTVSEWIFVVKSGSASILKKLQPVGSRPRQKPKQTFDFRENVLDLMNVETQLSHEEQIQLMFEEESRDLEDQNLMVRYFALPEINVKTNDSYNELKQMHDEFVNGNSVARAFGALEKMTEAGDVRSETGDSSSNTMPASIPMKTTSQRKMSLSNMTSKGPFLKTRGVRRGSAISNQGSELQREPSHVEDTEGDTKVDNWKAIDLPSLADSPINDLRISTPERKPVFVEVQNLTKGQFFGLSEILFDGQPNFSLVSNGSECIMIDKKFFMEHASQSLLVRLREKTYPYPSNEVLQDNLESKIMWDIHKQKELQHVLNTVRIKRADPNDARAGQAVS